MSEAERLQSRVTVDAVLAREGLDPDEEIRDRLARQLATMDAFRALLRTDFASSDAAKTRIVDANPGSATTQSGS